MTTYREAGVDVSAGDAASKAAYATAAKTFAARKGMVGEPVLEEGGYGGMLDLGKYYLVVTDDGTGTKSEIAFAAGSLKTLGSDLLAMVADDAVCTGAEVIAVSNTIDIAKVETHVIEELMEGLGEACHRQKIVIPAGEIAEVPGAVRSAVWSATAVGIVAKDRVIAPSGIAPGDVVIALRESGARCNGFSLIRKILTEHFGEQWHRQKLGGGTTWAESVLAPSVVYHAAVLELIGRYGEARTVQVKGIAHITGGGIPSKLRRTLRASGTGAELLDLWGPASFLRDLTEMGDVRIEEAYRTWNMGNGMLIVVSAEDAERSVQMLSDQGVEARVAGTITKDPTIVVRTFDGSTLQFSG
jgi:phosphoribosylformylglycinamidine cyclo-ligase